MLRKIDRSLAVPVYSLPVLRHCVCSRTAVSSHTVGGGGRRLQAAGLYLVDSRAELKNLRIHLLLRHHLHTTPSTPSTAAAAVGPAGAPCTRERAPR